MESSADYSTRVRAELLAALQKSSSKESTPVAPSSDSATPIRSEPQPSTGSRRGHGKAPSSSSSNSSRISRQSALPGSTPGETTERLLGVDYRSHRLPPPDTADRAESHNTTGKRQPSLVPASAVPRLFRSPAEVAANQRYDAYTAAIANSHPQLRGPGEFPPEMPYRRPAAPLERRACPAVSAPPASYSDDPAIWSDAYNSTAEPFPSTDLMLTDDVVRPSAADVAAAAATASERAGSDPVLWRGSPPPLIRLTAITTQVPWPCPQNSDALSSLGAPSPWQDPPPVVDSGAPFVARQEVLVLAPRPGLPSTTISIGCDPTRNAVVVTSPGVAPVHCLLTVDGDGHSSLRDLGRSPFGTTVEPSAASAALSPQDTANGAVLLQGHAMDLEIGDLLLFGDPLRTTCVYVLEEKRRAKMPALRRLLQSSQSRSVSPQTRHKSNSSSRALITKSHEPSSSGTSDNSLVFDSHTKANGAENEDENLHEVIQSFPSGVEGKVWKEEQCDQWASDLAVRQPTAPPPSQLALSPLRARSKRQSKMQAKGGRGGGLSKSLDATAERGTTPPSTQHMSEAQRRRTMGRLPPQTRYLLNKFVCPPPLLEPVEAELLALSSGPGQTSNEMSAQARRRYAANLAYGRNERLKPQIRAEIARQAWAFAARAHRFRAVHLHPLARSYAQLKLKRALRGWFATSVQEAARQRRWMQKLARLLRGKLLAKRWRHWADGSKSRRERRRKQRAETRKDPFGEDLFGDDQHGEVLLRLQYAVSFFAWKRRAAWRQMCLKTLENLLRKGNKLVYRRVFRHWIDSINWEWLAEARRFGLERCRVRCLMRPRFLRWAGHIAAPAAVWRVKRSRLGFDLLMATRLRLLAAAKRYWRWKVGLEAWWTWAGESESPEEAAQKRQRAESAKQRAFEARLHAKGRRVTPALSSGTKQRLKQQREQEREQEEELGDEQAPMAGPSSPTTRTTTTTGHGASPTATPATAVRTHTAAVYGPKPLVARYEHPAIPFKHPDVIPVSKRRPWLTGKVARGEATPSEVEKAKGVAKGVAKAAELADTVAKSNGEMADDDDDISTIVLGGGHWDDVTWLGAAAYQPGYGEAVGWSADRAEAKQDARVTSGALKTSPTMNGGPISPLSYGKRASSPSSSPSRAKNTSSSAATQRPKTAPSPAHATSAASNTNFNNLRSSGGGPQFRFSGNAMESKSATAAAEAQRRVWFRAKASTHEQWAIWTATAQASCLQAVARFSNEAVDQTIAAAAGAARANGAASPITSPALRRKHVVVSTANCGGAAAASAGSSSSISGQAGSGGGGSGGMGGAVAAADEFLWRAAGTCAPHLMRDRGPHPPPALAPWPRRWGWQLPEAGPLQQRAPPPVPNPRGGKSQRLVPRRWQTKLERGALRKVNKRIEVMAKKHQPLSTANSSGPAAAAVVDGEANDPSGASTFNDQRSRSGLLRVKWGQLQMWLPGGTKATVDLYCYQEPPTKEPEASPSPSSPSPSSSRKVNTVGATTKPTATRPVQMAAAAASDFSALPNPEGHRPLPESSGARLLAASSESLLESFSRSAKKATVQEREHIMGKAPRSFDEENELIKTASRPDSPLVQDMSPNAASEVDRGGATLRASTMNEIADGGSPSSKASPNAGSPTSQKSNEDGSRGGSGANDQNAVVSELLQANEAHLARHDVLAIVDLLKAAPLAAAARRMQPIVLVNKLVRQWRKRAGIKRAHAKNLCNWLNHSCIATTLALLTALQALELAGARVATAAGERVRGGPAPGPPPKPTHTTAASLMSGEAPKKPPKDIGLLQTYLRPHATHVALVIYHPSHRPSEPADAVFSRSNSNSDGGKDTFEDKPIEVAAIKHFNLSNWEIGVALLELLGSSYPDTHSEKSKVATPEQKASERHQVGTGEHLLSELNEAVTPVVQRPQASSQRNWKPARWVNT